MICMILLLTAHQSFPNTGHTFLKLLFICVGCTAIYYNVLTLVSYLLTRFVGRQLGGYWSRICVLVL